MAQSPADVELSILVPIYKDAYLAQAFVVEIERVARGHFSVEELCPHLELLFINDGSPDDSFAKLTEIARTFPFVRCIDLSRNFGQHAAWSCGLTYARGRFVALLNVDMQDPPDQIPLMLNAMKSNDADFALGVRSSRHSALLDRVSSRLFNWILNRLTAQELPLNAATLRIMNRRFVDAYNQLSERKRYLPGLESWLGFKRIYVPIRHQARIDQKSSYNLRKRASMAVDAVISFSDVPLKIVVFFGFLVAGLGFSMTLILVLINLLGIDVMPGYSSLASLALLLAGVQILVTGLAGLYVGATLNEVKRRPLYIIRETIHFGKEDL